MKKGSRKQADELRPEYKRSDFEALVRGKYAQRIIAATNVVVLDPQVAKAFPIDRFACDVLVVGGGGAGLRAVIAVAETHPKLRVAVISKVYPMRSHTVSAEGGAAAVIKAGDSLDAHAYDTISGGDWLSDQDAVEAFVREAPEEMLRLEHWGCPWSREPDGHIAVRPFGGMKIERT